MRSKFFLLFLPLGAMMCQSGAALAQDSAENPANGAIHLHEPVIKETRPRAAQPQAAQRGYTMEQAVKRALDANPGIEAKILVVEQARMTIGVAQSTFWPRLSLVASRDRLRNRGDVGNADQLSSDNYSYGMRLTMPLFAGFAHLNGVMKAKLAADVEKERLRQARLELLSTVQLQFLQFMKAKDDLNTALESVRRLETQGKAAEAFVKVGMAPRLAVLQNEADLATAKLQVIRTKNQMENALAQLSTSLALAPTDTVDYLGNLKDFHRGIHGTEAEAIRTALYRRPDLIVAQKSVAVAFKDVDIRKGEYAPKVQLNWDVMHDNHDYEEQLENYQDYSRSYWAVGINVSWDIFTGGDTTFGLLADRSRAEALRKDYENTVNGARTEVLAALRDIKATEEMITAAGKGALAAREGYAMANKRFETNTGSMTDLLTAQMKLTEAENQVNQAWAEHQGARARFWYSIGQENPSLR
jgi:outer membrane protein TolC